VVEYAEQCWCTPCKDGIIHTDAGDRAVDDLRHRLWGRLQPNPAAWHPFFLPEPNAEASGQRKERACFIHRDPQGEPIPGKYLPPELQGRFQIVPFHADKGLQDCSHFVAQALAAGGVPVNGNVKALVAQLRALRRLTKTLGLEVGAELGAEILGTGVMQKGDFIAYWYGPKDGYLHSGLYVGEQAGKHRICCHTMARFGQYFWDDDWRLVRDRELRYTFVHFTAADDRPPSAATAAALDGWWRVEASRQTEYWRFDPGGTVYLTDLPPKAAHATMHPRASGYWFEDRAQFGRVLIFWSNLSHDGRLDRWRLINPGTVEAIVGRYYGSAIPLFAAP
jgi:hypothetical protein